MLSGDWGPVWLRKAEHCGIRRGDAGCWHAHGRFQDAQLSGHQMGPERPEGTLCNHTQGTSGPTAQHLSQKCNFHLSFWLPLSSPLLNTRHSLSLSLSLFSSSPRPYVKLWRSGKNQVIHQERDGGAEPPLSAATSISILNMVSKHLTFMGVQTSFVFVFFPCHFHQPLFFNTTVLPLLTARLQVHHCDLFSNLSASGHKYLLVGAVERL